MIQPLLIPLLASSTVHGEFSWIVLLPALLAYLLSSAFGNHPMVRRLFRGSDEERMQLRLDEIERVMKMAPAHLNERFIYFAQLSDQGKEKFLARLRFILSTKYFVSKEGQSLSPEVELMTGAAFVQVTFGLKKFHLPRFQRIVVFPDIFYHKLLDRKLRGGTSPSGIIRFSWKHIEHGYAVADDNMNLALHELAHALLISAQKDDVIDDEFKQEMRKFNAVTVPFRNAILEGKLKHIRKYAGTNEHEFFACCVEYFFESPDHFKENLPRLFKALCEVLGQDPSNLNGDYTYGPEMLENGSSIYNRYVGRFRQRSLLADDFSGDWIGWLIVFGGVVGTPSAVALFFKIETSVVTILLFLISIAALGLVFFWRRLLLTGYMTQGGFTGFILCGWIPSVASISMLVNMFIPVYTAEVVDKVTRVAFKDNKFMVYCKHSELPSMQNGWVEETKHAKWIGSNMPDVQAVSKLSYGFLGLPVINEVTYRVKELTKSTKQ